MPRKSKSHEASPLERIRFMYELPFLMQFISLHQEKFKFVKLSIDEFEKCLLVKDSPLTADIVARLLRYYKSDTSILISNFHTSLCQLLKEKQTDFGQFSDLSPEEKLQQLKWLVDLIVENTKDDLDEFLNDSFDAESMRAVNTGQDAFNYTYWYFDDLRLYKENTSKKAGKHDWECVCLTLQDWQSLLKKFRKTTNTHEKELYDYLNNQLFPLVEVQLQNKQKERLESSPGKLDNKELTLEVLLEKEKQDIQNMVKVENMSADSKDVDVKTDNIEVKKESAESNNGKKVKPEPLAKTAGPGVQRGPHRQVHDSQFMQQRSQIFVFSTKLANKASEAMLTGQYDSILACHMDQPGTKKFLQKHPLKPSQFNKNPGLPTYSPISMKSRNMMTQSTVNGATQVSVGGQMMPDQMSLSQGANFNTNGNMQNLDWPGSPSALLPDITHNKVPNDHLTPEQLHRREESLANLRKIQEMLFPGHQGTAQSNGPPGQQATMGSQSGPPGMYGPHGPGMMPVHGPNHMGPYGPGIMSPGPNVIGDPNMPNMGSPSMMMSPQQTMLPQANVVMTQQNMMMSQTSQGMQMSPSMNSFPTPAGMDMMPHQRPCNNMAEKEWHRLQHEFYAIKQHQQHQQTIHAANPFADGDVSQGPPPPSYYSSVSQRHSSVSSGPTSPHLGGPSPMHSPALASPHMMSSGPRHFMYPPQRRPPPSSLGPGMIPEMPPEMNPTGPDIRLPSPVPMKDVMTGLASNPEPFQPDIPPVAPSGQQQTSVSKPPPTYAQSTKRKRDSMDDMFKNLQPAPSPQHFTYPNQFEGQELTISKQINTAYQENNNVQSPAMSQTGDNASGPGSVPAQGPSSVASAQGPASVPPPGTPCTPQTSEAPMFSSADTGGKINPAVAAGRRLSHLSSPAPVTPTTPSAPPVISKSSSSSNGMSNITSASLANLAKGVEDMSNQMQQSMMQGGPFHKIQVQSQSVEDVASKNFDAISSQVQSTGVNNTFVNATMSIGQVNIPQMNHHQGPHPGMHPPGSIPGQPHSFPDNNMMQARPLHGQQMMGQHPHMVPNPADSMYGQLPQSVHPGMQMLPGGASVDPQIMMPPAGHQMMLPGQPYMSTNGPHNVPSSMGMRQYSPGLPVPGMPMSAGPGFSPPPGGPYMNVGMMGPVPTPDGPAPKKRGRKASTTNVKVQVTAPNTIQYLPANPPASQQCGIIPPPQNRQFHDPLMEMEKFHAEPLVNLDSKVPVSKLSYFPSPDQNDIIRPPPSGSYPPPNQHVGVMPMGVSQQYGPNGMQLPSMQHPGHPMPGDSGMYPPHMHMPHHIQGPIPRPGMPPYGHGPEMNYLRPLGDYMSTRIPGPGLYHNHPSYGPQMGYRPGPDFIGPPQGDPRYINMMPGP